MLSMVLARSHSKNEILRKLWIISPEPKRSWGKKNCSFSITHMHQWKAATLIGQSTNIQLRYESTLYSVKHIYNSPKFTYNRDIWPRLAIICLLCAACPRETGTRKRFGSK